jgi:DNA-binding NtrC family response regulator
MKAAVTRGGGLAPIPAALSVAPAGGLTTIALAVASALPIQLRSVGLAEMLAFAQHVATLPTAPVLILAEPGSPTEDLAKVIHDGSGTEHRGPWVGYSCSGMPEGQSEIELLGDPYGESTQAPSAVGRALGGTLFIKSISNLGLSAQARLVAQLRRAGAERFRLIGATEIDLRTQSREGRFREDLLAWLSRITITIPPLRTRPDDIEALAIEIACQQEHLGKTFRSVSPEAISKLRAHSYPGNEAELDRCIIRAAATQAGARIEVSSIEFDSSPASMASVFVTDSASSFEQRSGRPPTLAEIERAYLLWALERTTFNRTAAARLLGISYPTIAKKISDYHIDLRALAQSSSRGGRRAPKPPAD